MLAAVDDPPWGSHPFARSTPHRAAAPVIPPAAAPGLGQHTGSILIDLLDYAPREVERLIDAGVVSTDEPVS